MILSKQLMMNIILLNQGIEKDLIYIFQVHQPITVNQPGRLIICQHNTHSNYPSSYYDRIRIRYADNDSSVNTQMNDFFPAFFSMNNYQSFNNKELSPAATIYDSNPFANKRALQHISH